MSRIGTPLGIAMLVGLCLASGGCASPTSVVSDQIDLPARWSTVSVAGADREESSGFELHSDGTVELWNMPGGVPRVVDSYKCFDRSDSTYSGHATWKANESGLLEISYDQETILWADAGFIGSFDWIPLTLADCDDDRRTKYNGSSLLGENYRPH